MKKFKFINQSLWAGSSPNQTGETLTRQNRIGVKSWLNRGLMLLITILTLGVGQMWGETIPANTIIYVDVANLNNGDWDSDGSYFMSVTASANSSHTTTASNTTGAGSYVPKNDATWITLSQVAGTLYAGKVTSQSTTGKVSFWTKNESTYDNCWLVNAALAQSYESSKRKFTISSGHTNHGDRNTSCFGTTTSSIDLFTEGQKLYLRVGTNWKSDGARFAACFLGLNDNQTQTWVSCTNVTSDFYTVTVPEGEYPYVIFCRMKGNQPANNWDNKMNQTDDLAPSSDGQGYNNCVWIADDAWSNSSSWTKYAPDPAVWMTSDHDYTTYKFVDGSVGISLSANTTYYFKVADGVEGGWWGYSDNDDYRKSFVGQSESHILYQGGIDAQKVLILKTAGAGTYTFNWNSSTHAVSVTYPTVTHPSSDYVYFKNNLGWSNVMGHLFNGTPASTGWHSLPVLSSFNFDGVDYYYAASGGSTSVLVAKETTDENDDKTADLTISNGKGKWYDVVSKTTSSTEVAANWKNFTATLTLLTTQGETRNPSPTSVTVTYGIGTNINTDFITTSPQHDGYTFGGYYTEPGGSGTQVITEGEIIPSNLGGYTSSGNWIKTGSSVSANLYAKWTQNVVLDKENGDSNGSVTLTYNSSSHAAITNPTRNGYTFAGWYTGDDGSGTLVINTSGILQASVTGYTGAGGIWTYDEGDVPTLHAKWTPVALTFSTAGNWNVAGNWTRTDNGEAGCVPTKDHDVTIGSEVTVNVNDAAAKSIAFSSGGKLIIPATGALEVAGTITNTEASKIVINSTTSNQGALIFNSTGSTAATVELALQYADPEGSYKHFQMVAIPVSYVAVSEAFAGTGAYTFAWTHGTGWDQRGYYEGFSAFEAVLVKGKAGTSFSGNLVSTANKSYTGLSIADVANGDVYMFGNSWTAPIKRSAMTCTNATVSILDGATQEWDGVISTDLIPALQGFAVVVAEGKTGSVTINYGDAVRIVTGSDHTTPLKAPQRYADEDLEPITVYVSGNELRTRIRLFEDETRFSDDLDEGWEAYYMEGEGLAGEMYAVGPEKKMNVLATANLEGTVVGFVPGQATDYTISFAGDGKGYYLNDMKTGKSTLIDDDNTYEFTSDESTNATRFVISKMPMTPTGIDAVIEGANARKQMIDGKLYIIRDGRIYTTTGALVK